MAIKVLMVLMDGATQHTTMLDMGAISIVRTLATFYVFCLTSLLGVVS